MTISLIPMWPIRIKETHIKFFFKISRNFDFIEKKIIKLMEKTY